ncbi:TlyA family RNA methyltransferase [Spiroplasma endosymbiont of Nephrotoma flavescens]|uniref:TlyA family RNA methyltransferase n=1 Tax=Spiroplasma endosymbiont of Nephrotoma flavescens TaxID=3066302 RepID=UPI00313D6C42
MKKIRLDILLVQKELFHSRTEAQSAIINHQVLVNEELIIKSGTLVALNSIIRIKKQDNQFVSRGGYKLSKALKAFNINLENLVCLDIGSSTGGFTDCMLQNQAKLVYSLDVGTNQLAWKLRIHPQVIVMESTNFRYVKKEMFKKNISFCAIDVAFISLTKIIPVLTEILMPQGQLVCLIKPQFESRKTQIEKGGVVKNPIVHYQVLNNLIAFFKEYGFSLQGLIYSPIVGHKKGNIEYLAHLSFNNLLQSKEINVIKLVDDAFNTLKNPTK